MRLSFFEWLTSVDDDNNYRQKFARSHNDNIRALCELMSETWASIQLMPYAYFIDTLRWKDELEEKKRKAIQERNKEQEAEHRRRANLQRAEERRAQRQQRR